MSRIFEQLDEKMPDWWMRVDLKKLENVLDQLFGSTTADIKFLGLDGEVLSHNKSQVIEEITIRVSEASISKLAEYLDIKNPGWWQKINTETLNQNNGRVCVLGQLYGEWEIGLRNLGLDGVEIAKVPTSTGFGSEYPGADTKRESWISEITNRRHVMSLFDVFKAVDEFWWIKVDTKAEPFLVPGAPGSMLIGGPNGFRAYGQNLDRLTKEIVIKHIEEQLTTASIPTLALFLDEKYPGWASKVTQPINMFDSSKNILAQLYGSVRDAVIAFGLNPLLDILASGFGVEYNNATTIKADTWTREIEKRTTKVVIPAEVKEIDTAIILATISLAQIVPDLTPEYVRDTTLAQFMARYVGKGHVWKL